MDRGVDAHPDAHEARTRRVLHGRVRVPLRATEALEVAVVLRPEAHGLRGELASCADLLAGHARLGHPVAAHEVVDGPLLVARDRRRCRSRCRRTGVRILRPRVTRGGRDDHTEREGRAGSEQHRERVGLHGAREIPRPIGSRDLSRTDASSSCFVVVTSPSRTGSPRARRPIVGSRSRSTAPARCTSGRTSSCGLTIRRKRPISSARRGRGSHRARRSSAWASRSCVPDVVHAATSCRAGWRAGSGSPPDVRRARSGPIGATAILIR